MRLAEHLCREGIIENLAASDKQGVLAELAGAAAAAGVSPDAALAGLLERERLGSTAVGEGIAIPHGKLPGLEKMLLVFARSRKGVNFAAPDNKPCHLFFMVLAPEGAAGQHLGILGAIARLAKDGNFTGSLLQARAARELAEFLSAV